MEPVLPANRSAIAKRTFELRSRSLKSLLRGPGNTKFNGDHTTSRTPPIIAAGPAMLLPRWGVPRNTIPLHRSSNFCVHGLSDAMFIAYGSIRRSLRASVLVMLTSFTIIPPRL